MKRMWTPLFLLLTSLPAFATSVPWAPLSADDFLPVDPARVELGRQLFKDPVLSGNFNISCQTCHLPEFGSADGVSLSVGEGGIGEGPKRTANAGIKKRVPRHAPPLWNLGHRSVTQMFWDGRLSIDPKAPSGFDSPAEDRLPQGLNSLLAAQAVLPLTAQFEMAGNTGENEVIGAARQRIDWAWPVIVERIIGFDYYWELLQAAYPELTRRRDVDISHLANAIGDFINLEFRTLDAPIDRIARGQAVQLSDSEQRGLALFYQDGSCAQCHSGPLMTNQSFVSLGLPPMGPGRTRPWDPVARDLGRMAHSNDWNDRYAFRVPSLRNVGKTAPYGHNGAYATLRGIIEHHNDPRAALDRYDRSQAILADAAHLERIDWIGFENAREMARLRDSIQVEPMGLSAQDIDDLIAFLGLLDSED
ncbi:methylamine utilization protein MauG [Litorivicinus lipolyticus]|jgi:cytochrome c peroxidase|uniref:Methylamine utilization protein MauG n=1 Tax=Litorivicinus lipolyticus TaxID=418701 RepID=A0A5Q2Q8S6_9GAMM|nr:cytochrome c peroxidase [Litorivicinus lipolyticus]QGG79254.1 methylamine utilization protein MauG [Litorivicinus lipolyticus]